MIMNTVSKICAQPTCVENNEKICLVKKIIEHCISQIHVANIQT